MADHYAGWGSVIGERFPGYNSPERDSAWAQVKEQLTVGQPVSGIVVARAPFGAWIDLGVGFPALLEITYIAGLTPEQYQAGNWCDIGSRVAAFIGSFRDNGHQIGLVSNREDS